MSEWQPSLKFYPHFDKHISRKNIDLLVRDPERVARNSFYPFLLYSQGWQPFRQKDGKRPPRKDRPIRYASRRDAYIFSFYRNLLAPLYEKRLTERGLNDSVIAYRKLKDGAGKGKSNIEFARDAVLAIKDLAKCAVVTLDISSFFESLDHELLNKKWCEVLGLAKLPPDHAAVFRAITSYAVAERDAVYERLGFASREVVEGFERLVYRTDLNDMPRQLCSNKEFRQKICGNDPAFSNLISVNNRNYGIPQGSPISDIIANLYLINFDVIIKDYCKSRDGIYYRYSDDIIMIVPGGQKEAFQARDFCMAEILKHGSKLVIKAKKTSVLTYCPDGSGNQSFEFVDGLQGRNGLEYLGFRYDGRCVRIRDATIARLYRKVATGVRAASFELVARYPGKDLEFLISRFDYSAFMQRFGRVEDFDPEGAYGTWTFWTYARRALATFGTLGLPISSQLRNYRGIVRSRVSREISRRIDPST